MGRRLLGSELQRGNLRLEPEQCRRFAEQDAGLAQCLGRAGGHAGQTKAALLERDTAKRAEMYKELQKKVRETGPFI